MKTGTLKNNVKLTYYAFAFICIYFFSLNATAQEDSKKKNTSTKISPSINAQENASKKTGSEEIKYKTGVNKSTILPPLSVQKQNAKIKQDSINKANYQYRSTDTESQYKKE